MIRTEVLTGLELITEVAARSSGFLLQPVSSMEKDPNHSGWRLDLLTDEPHMIEDADLATVFIQARVIVFASHEVAPVSLQ